MAGSLLAILSAAALAVLIVPDAAEASEFSTQASKTLQKACSLVFFPPACTLLEQQEAGIDLQQQWRDPCFTSWCRRFPSARCETHRCTAQFFVGSTDVTDNCDVGKSTWRLVQFAPKCSKTAGTNLFRAVKCHFLHCL